MPDNQPTDLVQEDDWLTELFKPTLEAEDRKALERLEYKPGKPKGQVQNNITGTRAQYDLITEWLGVVPEKRRSATRRLLVHLLASTPSALRRKSESGQPDPFRGYVPLYSKFIEEHFRGADWKALVASGLLLCRPYSRVKRRSNEFRVAPGRYGEFLEAGPHEFPEAGLTRVDLATGRPSIRRVKSDKTTASRNSFPPLVLAAIDAIGPSPFNPGAIHAHVERLRARVASHPEGSREAKSALHRYLNDRACFDAVFQQGAKPIEGGSIVDGPCAGELWEYRPAYQVQSTGRIGQKGGGLQSCSRAMKEAAYVGVPDLVNLDLKSSQARILIVLMEEAGIDPTWLRRYGGHPEGKVAAATYVGIAVGTWKECLYAALMGAHVPTERRAAQSKGAIKKAIMRDVGAEDFDATYGRFKGLTAALHDELGRWHEHLVTDYVAEHGRRNNVDGKTYLVNGVGAKIAVEDIAPRGEPYRRKARLASFLLQGREAAFTHALTASSKEYGFRVISHEHDGVVTVGSVPPEAVEAAAAGARLPLDLVDLIEKPFV